MLIISKIKKKNTTELQAIEIANRTSLLKAETGISSKREHVLYNASNRL